MPIRCETFKPTFFDVLRLTTTNNCGRPVYGPTSTWTVDMPMSVQVTRNMSEPEAPTLTRPDGRMCWTRPVTPTIQSYDLQIGLCGIDPAMMTSLNTANNPVYDYRYNVVGWDETTRRSTLNVALEGWMTIPEGANSACQETGEAELIGEGRWQYVAFYNLTSIQESGDFTYGGEATAFTVAASASPTSAWGGGPYDVQLNPGSPPRPGPWITPVASDAGKRVSFVDVAPPEPTCGPRPLSNPAAPLVFIQPGSSGMEMCVQVLADGGEWVVDFGDGSPTQQFTADEEVCHAYVDEGCYNIGVWAVNNPNLYRGEHWCLPQTLGFIIEPSSGEVPLEVVGTVTGATGQPTIDWGD